MERVNGRAGHRCERYLQDNTKGRYRKGWRTSASNPSRPSFLTTGTFTVPVNKSETILPACILLVQDSVHSGLSSQPAPGYVPFAGRIDQLNLKIPIQLHNNLGELHHGKILANAISRAGTKLGAGKPS